MVMKSVAEDERELVEIQKDEEETKIKKTGKEKRKERRLRNEPQNFIGPGEGPSGVNPLDFADARALELKSMLKALESKEGGKRVFQRLPRHMRRRAMSHNPKRLPRRLREIAAREAENENEAKKKKKPPCRRKRRKPSSLRQEYCRRQRKNIWLETHIWHAKRMKMCDLYGYRLAKHCSDKGIRAAHKSLVHGCLLSDISYYCCNEISGHQTAIIACLCGLFAAETGLTIQAKSYLGGQREGKAVLYKPGSYPYGAIAPVHFLWQASLTGGATATSLETNGEENTKENVEKFPKLWIWCHCAAQDQVLNELQTAIQSYNKKMECESSLSESKVEDTPFLSPHKVRIAPRNLLRFRLIGPRSHALLMETLKPVWDKEQKLSSDFNSRNISDSGCSKSLSESDSEEEEEDDDDVSDSGESTIMDTEAISLPPAEKWWLGELESQMTHHSDVLASEYPTIKSATGPDQFMPGVVLGVCVQDPRLFTPTKKTDMVSSFYPQKMGLFCEPKNTWMGKEEENKKEELGVVGCSGGDSCVRTPQGNSGPPSTPPGSLPPDVAFSPIWDSSVCNSVSKSKIPNHVINLKRSEKFNKSSVLNLGDCAPQIPVMLIQQTPQFSRASLGVGWDLVLPPEWGMAFWIALIYRGARACGMKELQKCSLESQVPHFSRDFPDTDTGCRYNLEQRKELEMQYLRKPPDKRLNYGKLLITTPFYSPWVDLVRYWSKRCTWNIGLKGVKRELETTEIDVVCKKVKLESNEEGYSKVSCESLSSKDVESEWSSEIEIRSGLLSNGVDSSMDGGFYVLRSREALSSLKLLVKSVFTTKKRRWHNKPSASVESNVLHSSFEDYSIESLLKKHSTSLVPVRIDIEGSGNVSNLDSLSLPTLSDLHSLLASNRYTGPTEEMNQRGMTVIGKEAVIVGISSLTRKEMKAVKKCRKKKSTMECSFLINDSRLFPAKPSRITIGHVTSAGYRLTTSLSSGLGFVTLGGLVEDIACCHTSGATKLLALARGAKTKYYFVEVHIV